MASKASPALKSVALGLYLARDYDGVLRQTAELRELHESSVAGHQYQGLAQLQKGMHGEAIRSLAHARDLAAGRPINLGRVGYVYGVAGQPEQALKVLAELKDRSTREYIPALSIPTVFIGLGQKAEALDWLRKAWKNIRPA